MKPTIKDEIIFIFYIVLVAFGTIFTLYADEQRQNEYQIYNDTTLLKDSANYGILIEHTEISAKLHKCVDTTGIPYIQVNDNKCKIVYIYTLNGQLWKQYPNMK